MFTAESKAQASSTTGSQLDSDQLQAGRKPDRPLKQRLVHCGTATEDLFAQLEPLWQ